MHQIIPDDAKAEHILWWLPNILYSEWKIKSYEDYYRGMDGHVQTLYHPTDVQFLGPGMKSDYYKQDRITIFYDANRRITNIGVG